MRASAKILAVLAFATGLTATAQTPPAPSPAPADRAAPAPDVVPAKPAEPPRLSVGDMRTRSLTLAKQITDDHRSVLHLRELAKKQKDVIKLTCVNDRLVQVKAQQNLADNQNDQLQDALGRETDERYSLFLQFSTTAEAIKRLREEATACVGEPELYKQESGGTAVDHPVLPDDPTVNPFVPELEPPAYATPYS